MHTTKVPLLLYEVILLKNIDPVKTILENYKTDIKAPTAVERYDRAAWRSRSSSGVCPPDDISQG
jgi:hypothetical protein